MLVNVPLVEGLSLSRNDTSADDISNVDVEKFLIQVDLNKVGKVTTISKEQVWLMMFNAYI